MSLRSTTATHSHSSPRTKRVAGAECPRDATGVSYALVRLALRRETRWLSSCDCRSNLQVAGVSPGRDAGKNSGARLLGKCSVITFAVSSIALARAIPSLTISGGGKGRARWG